MSAISILLPSLPPTLRFPNEDDELRLRRASTETQAHAAAKVDEGSPGSLAEGIIRALAPRCSSIVFSRLKREGVVKSEDLKRLHRNDLLDLGLTMVERSRILAWASGSDESMQQECSLGLSAALSARAMADTFSGESEESLRWRLDEVESNAAFWCGLLSGGANTTMARLQKNLESLEEDEVLNDLDDVQSVFSFDVRENVLEMLFDLTPERVKKVYDGIDRDADGRISLSELGKGLQQYRLPELSEAALRQILDRIPTGQDGRLGLLEFEAVLSRLKLAQLLKGHSRHSENMDELPLTLVDYTPVDVNIQVVDGSQLLDFFFGHRPLSPEHTLVRWVHTKGLDFTILLALTVKYNLHPLSVEDVIEQSPTKIDRNGNHYFVAIEQLCLDGPHDGCSPVFVKGRHVTMFCAGPPRLDTIVTISQADRSFAAEWPGASREDRRGDGDMWVDRIHERLRSPLSRLRERRTDFLMHQVMDLCTDDLVVVVRAYMKRLGRLEMELHERGSSLPSEWTTEVMMAKTQLMVVVRRVRGLQRLLRQVLCDPDLGTNSLRSYFQDIADHLNEAYDDACQLAERCSTIVDAYNRAVERGLERSQQVMAERLNRTLFFLTAGTTILAPLQFIVGVYGMNFQDEDGRPSIPELNWSFGYTYFWTVVLVYLFLSCACALYMFYNINKRKQANNSAESSLGAPRSSSGRHVSTRAVGATTSVSRWGWSRSSPEVLPLPGGFDTDKRMQSADARRGRVVRQTSCCVQ